MSTVRAFSLVNVNQTLAGGPGSPHVHVVAPTRPADLSSGSAPHAVEPNVAYCTAPGAQRVLCCGAGEG